MVVTLLKLVFFFCFENNICLCIVFLAVVTVSDFDKAQAGTWGASCLSNVMLSAEVMEPEECGRDT